MFGMSTIMLLVVGRMLFNGARQVLRLPILHIALLSRSHIGILPIIVRGLLSIVGCLVKGTGADASIIGPMLMQDAQRLLIAICRLHGKNRIAIIVLIGIILGLFI